MAISGLKEEWEVLCLISLYDKDAKLKTHVLPANDSVIASWSSNWFDPERIYNNLIFSLFFKQFFSFHLFQFLYIPKV